MRLVVFLLTAACLSAAAKGSAQQKVTIKLKEVPVQAVFVEIIEQTGMSIVYDEELFRNHPKVSVDVKDATPADVVHQCVKGMGVEVLVQGNKIVIKEKQKVQNITPPPIDVRGRITNEEGEPVVATVAVKGTNIATTSDAEGFFTLQGVEDKAVLVISGVNIETREFKLNKNSNVVVRIKKIVSPLDEVQIIAYGATSRRFNTGNVSTIKGQDIEGQPVMNPLLTLAGRVPGLFISQASGMAGSGVITVIQGQNSLANGNDPFYVVDGVPYTQQLLPNLGAIMGESGITRKSFGNPLSFINSADIESISILKGADATAIYGSRAANGAIIIITKKGRVGETKLNLNIQHGWGAVTRKLDVLNTQQYQEMRNEALKNDGIASPTPSDYDINGLWDQARNTDWQQELLGKTAKYTNINTNLSGGTSSLQYVLSGTYQRQSAVFPGNFSNQKGALHTNLNSVSANQKFKIQFSANYMIDDNELPGIDLTQTALTLPPNAPELYDEDGSVNWAPDNNGKSSWPGARNPIGYTLLNYKNITKNLISNVLLSYQISPWVEIKSSLGYTSLQSNETVANPMTSSAPEERPFRDREGNYSDNNINSWIIEPQLLANKNIGGGNLNAVIGFTIQHENRNGYQLGAIGFNSDDAIADINSATAIFRGSSTISKYKYNAGFARIVYSLKEKYLINFSGRRDGSSRFGSDSRFHNFGSVGFGWIVSEEKFMKEHLRILTFAKLRTSFGTTGSDQIGDYSFLNLYTNTYSGVPYQGILGMEPSGISNPYLQWEETKKWDIGFDFSFLHERLMISATWYRNRSSNQLMPYSYSIVTGVGSVTTNFPANVQNSGWEFSVTSKNISNSVIEWNTNYNLTIGRNKLIKFPNLNTSSYANAYFEGRAISSVRLIKFGGVDPAAGSYQFITAKGNLTINPIFPDDQFVFKDLAPKFYGGVQNNIRFKGFDLEFLFQFTKQLASSYAFGKTVPGYRFQNQPVSVLDRWQVAGDTKPIQRFNSNYNIIGNYFNALSSDATYTDGSFVRLKNLSFGWTLPVVWNKRMGLEFFRFYIEGQNLLTITNYNGLDPETKGVLYSDTPLPPLKIITVGIQARL